MNETYVTHIKIVYTARLHYIAGKKYSRMKHKGYILATCAVVFKCEWALDALSFAGSAEARMMPQF